MEFTYENIIKAITGDVFFWNDTVKQLESLMPISEVEIAYPKAIFDDNKKEDRVFLFTPEAIYDLRVEDTRAYRLTVLRVKDIVKIDLEVQGKKEARLQIQLQDEKIELSSSDSTDEYLTYQFTDTIIKIARMYTN